MFPSPLEVDRYLYQLMRQSPLKEKGVSVPSRGRQVAILEKAKFNYNNAELVSVPSRGRQVSILEKAKFNYNNAELVSVPSRGRQVAIQSLKVNIKSPMTSFRPLSRQIGIYTKQIRNKIAEIKSFRPLSRQIGSYTCWNGRGIRIRENVSGPSRG